MPVSSENRLLRKATGEAVGPPRLAKADLRTDLIVIIEGLTGGIVGPETVTTERLTLQTDDLTQFHEVTLSARNGLNAQAKLVVHGEQDAFVDLSDNPTEVPHAEALAAREVLDSLRTECLAASDQTIC